MAVRVFLFSPGDLFPERAVVKRVINELNELNALPQYRDRLKLIPFAYEDAVPPRLAVEPQPVVDRYLLQPEAADVFICLL